MKNEKKVKPKNHLLPDLDVCNKCGSGYYDILGIGSCPKCFNNVKKLYNYSNTKL